MTAFNSTTGLAIFEGNIPQYQMPGAGLSIGGAISIGGTANQINMVGTAHSTTLDFPNPGANRIIAMADCGYSNCFLAPNLQNTSGIYAAKRGVTGCTTGSTVGSNCGTATLVGWPAAFPDANYSVTCSGGGTPTGVPTQPYIVSQTASGVTVNYFAITAAAAQWPSVDCVAVHD